MSRKYLSFTGNMEHRLTSAFCIIMQKRRSKKLHPKIWIWKKKQQNKPFCNCVSLCFVRFWNHGGTWCEWCEIVRIVYINWLKIYIRSENGLFRMISGTGMSAEKQSATAWKRSRNYVWKCRSLCIIRHCDLRKSAFRLTIQSVSGDEKARFRVWYSLF